jgi:hypothetical protein
MRALWITLALTLAPGLTRADVVYSVTSAPDLERTIPANSSGFTNTIGQSFLNISQTAFVDSVMFKLRSSSAFTTGTLQVAIYAVDGTPGSKNYFPTGTALATSATINASTVGTSATDFTFNNFTTITNLSSSTAYMAVLQLSGLDFASNTLGAGAFASIPAGTYQNYNLAFSGTANTTQQMYGTINVTAVPEPGTLLLGSIAAACGGGAWWRRKRHQASKATAQESVA